MQLSRESYRIRWFVLVAVWSAAVFALTTQTKMVADYLDLAGRLGLRGAAAPATPMQAAYPAFAADGQVWVRHALALLHDDQMRLRHTQIDNAPDGREVHWNSAWAWTIAGAGALHQLFSGKPITHSLELAARWLNPAVLFLLTAIFSIWATRRAGVIAGVMVAAGMICKDRIYEGFFPSYVDHHGLLSVAAFGCVLGAVFMGAGWWQPAREEQLQLLPRSAEVSRQGAVFSALSGACGLWVSAASVIPPVGMVGAAGILAIIIQGRHASTLGAHFDAASWRLWGRVGAGASIFFYLLEYFPNHLGLRMEANHPFYALAWLAGGELIAQFGERWLGEKSDRWARPATLIWPVACLCLAPATILIGGTKVFVVADPFLSRLHSDYIQEFQPLWKTLRGFDHSGVVNLLMSELIPLAAAIATITYRRRDTPLILWFATAAALMFGLMGWVQSRWLLNAAGSQICLIIVLVGCWIHGRKIQVRWAVAVATCLALFVPSAVTRISGSAKDLAAKRVAPKDANSALFRDVAQAIRNSMPQGEITLLASPNASTGISYYGLFRSLGTLYWENNAGLKAAAAIFAARSENEAAELLKKHKVTHIALVAEENFIGQYFMLLNPKATLDEVRKCFGHQLLLDKSIPQWLQILPYAPPADLTSLNPQIMLFKVNFDQSKAEALYHVALAQIASGTIDAGEATLDMIIREAPQNYQPWLRKAELLVARRSWDDAATAVLEGIARAPAKDRPALYTSAGHTFYSNGQPAQAARVYQHALKQEFIPEIACFLAWIRATSKEDSLRDGDEALRLLEAVVKSDPNSPTYFSALGAAMAEKGRFPEALQAFDRALAGVQIGNNPAAIQSIQRRIDTLRRNQPIRE